VNVHHHAESIERYVAERAWDAEILISHEPERPLETGGGLLHARQLFRRDRPIILHNVDVITDADLGALAADQKRSGALVTLAVNERESSRFLLFDDAGLFGREDFRHDLRLESRAPRGEVRSFAFAGIHLCSPELLDLITEQEIFPILKTYLRLAAEGRRIDPWLVTGLWLEIGNTERLEAAQAWFGRTASA
jgi:NDP-sugar pyrophosphorylase family protein